MKEKQIFCVVVRRDNGRFVREYERESRYAAKKLARQLELKYDLVSYYIEVKKVVK